MDTNGNRSHPFRGAPSIESEIIGLSDSQKRIPLELNSNVFVFVLIADLIELLPQKISAQINNINNISLSNHS